MDISVDSNEGALISLLLQCKVEIANLRARLEQQQTLKTSLEQKLAIARSLKSSVSRLPKELLSMIFFELIYDDPRAIGPILFVCRHWSNLVTNSPIFWSRTSARFPADIPGIKREGNYLKTAIRYGGTAPLYVDIRLPSLGDLWEHLGRRFLEPACGYSNEWLEDRILDPMDDLGIVEHWLHAAVDHRKPYESTFPPYKYTDLVIYAELFSVANAIRSQVSRLRSLTLYFSVGQLTSWLFYGGFNLFYEQTPMLEELIFVTNNRVRQEISATSDVFFLHPIPSLTRLSWKADWPVKTILSPMGRLSHLRIRLYTDYTDFPPNEYTSKITHLFLENPLFRLYWDDHSFFLPHLEDLTIKNEIPLNFIKAPRLTTLRLMDRRASDVRYNNSPEFTSLERLHVHEPSNAQIEHLKAYIGCLPHMTEVAILTSRNAKTKDWMKELRGRNISLKAYRPPPDAKKWSFDYESYTTNEIPLDC